MTPFSDKQASSPGERMKLWVGVAIMLAVAGFAVFANWPASAAARGAAQRLARTAVFSLGPVGADEEIPERETWFFTVLASRQADRLFEELFEQGTPEAKLYALAGLQLTYHKAYERRAAKLAKENVEVCIQAGEELRKTTTREVISVFRNGGVKTYLRLREE